MSLKFKEKEDFLKELKEGDNVNLKIKDGFTFLHYAAFSENIELLKKLLESGANINAKDDKGNTAFSIAVVKNNKEILKILLNNPNLNIKDNLL